MVVVVVVVVGGGPTLDSSPKVHVHDENTMVLYFACWAVNYNNVLRVPLRCIESCGVCNGVPGCLDRGVGTGSLGYRAFYIGVQLVVQVAFFLESNGV